MTTRTKRAALEPSTITCGAPYCRAELEQTPGRGRPRLFCDSTCRSAARRVRDWAKKPPKCYGRLTMGMTVGCTWADATTVARIAGGALDGHDLGTLCDQCAEQWQILVKTLSGRKASVLTVEWTPELSPRG